VRYLAASILGIYVVWIIVSVVAHLFVLNARTLKPLVPLFSLLSGWGLASMSRLHLKLGWAIGAILAVSGVANFLPHYWFVFPRQFEDVAVTRVGNPKRTASLSGCYFDTKISAVNAPGYVLINAQYLFPVRAAEKLPAGETILSAAHPLEYVPYQYDGFTPRQRRILRSADIRMRLVRLADPHGTPDFPPAEFRSVNEDWPDGFDSEAAIAGKPDHSGR
jgi:hypothetical protein